MSRAYPASTILGKYFSVVKELKGYLFEILQPSADGTFLFMPNADDTPSYTSLVNTSHVAMKAPLGGGRLRFQVFDAMANMHEVLDKAQEKIFKSKQPHNIITAGYRIASRQGDRGKQGLNRPGVTNYFVNTVITALQAPEWETLLQRIGVDAMLFLLTETNIFVALPNRCLCQMTGVPVIFISPDVNISEATRSSSALNKRVFPFVEQLQNRPPVKRQKLSSVIEPRSQAIKLELKNPADIVLVRARLFYSRPRLVPHTNQIIVGLPDKHILNKLKPAYQKRPSTKPEDFVDPDPRDQARMARHLSKYIFPRQYGLSSPFQFASRTRGAFELPNYQDRESEISLRGPCKTPRRLKGILSLLESMVWRHGKCGYKPLRDKACPSKLNTTGSENLDSRIILELMSEQPSQLRSQASFGAGNISHDSEGNSIRACGQTQAEMFVKAKPRFNDFSCTTVEVHRYIALVTMAVVPKAFWGCNSNLKLILQHVKTYIQCRRFETLSLHHILQGFSTSECSWLMPSGTAFHKQIRVSVSDSLKRRELLEEFLYWYFDSFVSLLLKTNFYITESSAFRNRVLYFRQDDWDALCTPLIERLTTGTFEKLSNLDAKEVLRQRKLGFSFVRLLPKDTGVRPIVNLRRRKPTNINGYSTERSINQILQAAFQILTYEKKSQPHLLGASVFGADEVYPRLKEFKSRLPKSPDGKLPKLYFVKVDVQACFDTIDQRKLLEILRDLISEDIYMNQKYGQVGIAGNKIKRMFIRKARPEDDHPHFLRYATELAGVLRDTIFVDQVTYSYSKKEEILQLLEEHITENIVKIGHFYYRQTVGIPQGSVLSALLCSFFYGDLEKRFENFRDDLQSLLLRLIDDYLFITTSLSRAKRFLDMMNQGHPEYGCFISREKTLTNFDYDAQILNVTEPKQRHFPWCGFTINMNDLSVSVDYTRYHGTNLSNTLTVDRGRRPGAAFLHKMLWLARAKSHPIYSDIDLNTERVVYLNVYQNFLLCAMKMHSYLRDWGLKAEKNVVFLRDTIQKMINLSYSATRNKCSLQYKTKRPVIQKFAVMWLGIHAFHKVLSQRPQRYRALLQGFSFHLTRPRYRKYRLQFRDLTKDGQEGMLAQIPF